MDSPAKNSTMCRSVKPMLALVALPLLVTLPCVVVEAGQIPVVPPITVVTPPPAPTPSLVVPAQVPASPNIQPPAGSSKSTNDPGSAPPASVTEAADSSELATVEALRSLPVSALSYRGLREADHLTGIALDRQNLSVPVKSGLQVLRNEIEAELSGSN